MLGCRSWKQITRLTLGYITKKRTPHDQPVHGLCSKRTSALLGVSHCHPLDRFLASLMKSHSSGQIPIGSREISHNFGWGLQAGLLINQTKPLCQDIMIIHHHYYHPYNACIKKKRIESFFPSGLISRPLPVTSSQLPKVTRPFFRTSKVFSKALLRRNCACQENGPAMFDNNL